MSAKPILGIVGGIGAGKSTVAKAFIPFGAGVVSADEAGHAVLADPDIQREIRRNFGDGVFAPDGSVDRKQLARVIFADAESRRKLEALVHPAIGEGVRREIQLRSSDPNCRFVVLDAAVMLEAGWNDVCDRIVFVDAPAEVRKDRVLGRGWSAADWAAREAAQLSLDAKKARADSVISNAPDSPALAGQIAAILEKWRWNSLPAPETFPGRVE